MRKVQVATFLAIGVAVLHAASAFAQTPQWLLGQWTLAGPSTVRGESNYEIKYLFTADRVTHLTRGGPADHAKGIVCAVGFSTTYRVVSQTPSSITIEMSATDMADIYKPSQYCFEQYVKSGMYPPQRITVTPRDDGSAISLGGRLSYTKRPVDRNVTPSEWCKADAGCITAWGNMVLDSMRR